MTITAAMVIIAVNIIILFLLIIVFIISWIDIINQNFTANLYMASMQILHTTHLFHELLDIFCMHINIVVLVLSLV